MSETAGVTFTEKYTPIWYFENNRKVMVFMNANVPVNSTDKIVLILLAVLAVVAVRIVISFFKPDKPKAGAKPHRRSAKAAGLTEVIVGIDGMMCGMCEAHIKDAIRGQFPQAKGALCLSCEGTGYLLSAGAADHGSHCRSPPRGDRSAGVHGWRCDNRIMKKKGVSAAACLCCRRSVFCFFKNMLFFCWIYLYLY